MMTDLYIDYLSGTNIAALKLTDQEILDAVEEGLRLQGLGKTRIWPREHLIPKDFFIGVMNVLRGFIDKPINCAGVKIVSDFVENYKYGLKSEMALLNLFDPTDDPKLKVIVVNQAIPGTTEAFRRVREKRSDILFLAGEGHEDPGVIASATDLVTNKNSINRSLDRKSVV